MSLGAELETRNTSGDTPLHSAVQSENLRTSKDLLLKGAERDTRNDQEMSNKARKQQDLNKVIEKNKNKWITW